MLTLEELHRRIGNAGEMQSVVSSMKVLAVVSIRQFERSLASLSDYSRAVELGLQAVIQQGPLEIREAVEDFETDSPNAARNTTAQNTMALILGSEQGLSGQFNEQIVSFALDTMDRLNIPTGSRRLVTLGDHAAFRLKSMNLSVEKTFPIQGSVDGMTRCIREVFMHIAPEHGSPVALVASQDAPVLIFHNKPLSGAHYQPRMSRLLPIDVLFLKELSARPWPSRSVPTFTMDALQIFRKLMQQHIRIMVERAYVESLLSENTSRLLAMQVAEKNIGEYLEDLQHDFNNRRQGEITAELLDIVAGSEALSADYS